MAGTQPPSDTHAPRATSSRVSRRRFLAGVGAAGATGVLGAGVAPGGLVGTAAAAGPTDPALAGAPAACSHAARADSFGRLFPRLEPFAVDSPALRAALLDIGRPGGILDAADDLAAGPVRLITDPSLSLVNQNNPTHSAGVTFVGQFVDHDITFDAGSPLGIATAPGSARNSRTPMLDLDSVYGAGPVAQAELYDPADGIRLRVESGGHFEDLARRPDGTALIADPRNDSNLIIAGLHAAFCLFHNNAVGHVRRPGQDALETFAQARRLTTWHYQWLLVHQFLPLFAGQSTVEDVLAHGPRHYRPQGANGAALIPVEFSGAAYRFGHSMVRPSYRANLAGDNGQPFFGLIFDPSTPVAGGDPADLRGGCRAPRRFIGWQTFFDFGDGAMRPNKLIDTTLSTPLFGLPASAIAHVPGTNPGPTALPQRTLLRHLTWSLPSGQAVARHMGLPVLARGDLADLSPYSLGLDRRTPLWFYLLREAEVQSGGLTLGPVGARIVTEVLVGLLRADPHSYLSAQPSWRPTLGGRGGAYDMTSFLTFAGVDPASRGQ